MSGKYVQILDATRDQGISSTVGVLVPAVCSADLDFGEYLLDLLDLFEQFWAGEVAAVQRLRANGDGSNDIFVAWDNLLQGFHIGFV